MKNLMILVLLLAAPLAQAGKAGSGGGVGVRCEQKGTFELLDLHEGKRRGLNYNFSATSKDEAVRVVSDIFAKHFWNRDTVAIEKSKKVLADRIVGPIFAGKPFFNFKTERFEKVEFVDALPLSDDIGRYDIDKGCKLEQIAYFSDKSENLSIVKSKWEELSLLGKAALVGHELAYMLDRREALENSANEINNASLTSERTRYFVASLFSTTGMVEKSRGVPVKPLNCTSQLGLGGDNLTYFYTYPSGQSEFSSVFNVLHGYSSLYQIKAVFKDAELRELTDFHNGKLARTAQISFSGAPENYSAFEVHIKKVPGMHATIQAFNSKLRTPVNPPQNFLCY